jgi:predicted small lipoprotein YifL
MARNWNLHSLTGFLVRFRGRILRDGTLTARAAFMKRRLLPLVVLGLLVALAGCGQSNSADKNPAADTNTNNAAETAQESASKAWQDTKGAAINAWIVAKIGATNAWNAAKVGATNAWNKTTNAIH